MMLRFYLNDIIGGKELNLKVWDKHQELCFSKFKNQQINISNDNLVEIMKYFLQNQNHFYFVRIKTRIEFYMFVMD